MRAFASGTAIMLVLAAAPFAQATGGQNSIEAIWSRLGGK